jgi:putative tryptophan/tyrosine transport system substrate-binding protein
LPLNGSNSCARLYPSYAHIDVCDDARLPTIVNSREHAEAGALMSYGPNFHHLFRRCSEYVDRILRGANPAELPVEQLTKFDLVINLVTAKALRLDMPTMLLARADEVIE